VPGCTVTPCDAFRDGPQPFVQRRIRRSMADYWHSDPGSRATVRRHQPAGLLACDFGDLIFAEPITRAHRQHRQGWGAFLTIAPV